MTTRAARGVRDLATLDPGRLAGPPFVANIDLACRVFTNEDRGQAGFRAALFDELPDFGGDLLADFLGDVFSVQTLSCHDFTFPVPDRSP